MIVPKITNEPYDLIVILKAENNGDAGYFAAALTCLSNATDKRPIVGAYFLNFADMKKSKLNENYYFSVFVHEFAHILGFAYNRVGDFVDKDMNQLTTFEVVQSKKK